MEQGGEERGGLLFSFAIQGGTEHLHSFFGCQLVHGDNRLTLSVKRSWGGTGRFVSSYGQCSELAPFRLEVNKR